MSPLELGLLLVLGGVLFVGALFGMLIAIIAGGWGTKQ